MTEIKREDIAFITIDDKDVCLNCATKDELKDVTLEDIKTDWDLKKLETIIFCDRCGKSINNL